MKVVAMIERNEVAVDNDFVEGFVVSPNVAGCVGGGVGAT